MKILTLLAADLHLKEDNIESILSLVDQMINHCKKHKVSRVFFLGDIFHSRKAQRQIVLDAFDDVLKKFRTSEVGVVAIPGNHDKTLYNAHTSFLKPFRFHPGFTLVSEPTVFSVGNFKIDLFPFFEEEMFLGLLDVLKGNKSDFLFTHTAFEGSVNNDGSRVSTPVKPALFKRYKKVFSGHYHNQHTIGDNIFHIPSIQQNNFGEDDQKGFTAIFEDGSHELIVSDFKRFEKVKINLDVLSPKEVDKILSDHSKDTKDSNIRIEFTGDDAKLKSLKKETLIAQGFDVKTKSKSIEKSIELAESGEVMRYNDSSILDEFNEFCDKMEISSETGVKYVKKRLEDGKKEGK